eukprot:2961556-Pyramimonas_sp.AAC.1
MQHSTVQYPTIQYNTIQLQYKYEPKHYTTIHYSTVEYNTIHYNTIQPDHTLARFFFALPGAKITLRCGAGAMPWSGPPPTTAEENQFLNWDYNRSLIGKIAMQYSTVQYSAAQYSTAL